jgi:hypothetical protein
VPLFSCFSRLHCERQAYALRIELYHFNRSTLSVISEKVYKMSLHNSIESIGGGGLGGFGGGGEGGLILGLLLGRGLLGGGVAGQEATLGVNAYQMGVNAGENFTKSNGFAMQNDINANITASTNSLNQTIRNVGDASFAQVAGVKDSVQTLATGVLGGFNAQTNYLQNSFAGVTGAITQAQFAETLNSNNLSRQLAEATCAIKTAVDKDGDATRALINSNTVQSLRDKLNETQRERDLLATGNFPIGRAAQVIEFNPCQMNSHLQALTQAMVNIGSGTLTGNQNGAVLK